MLHCKKKRINGGQKPPLDKELRFITYVLYGAFTPLNDIIMDTEDPFL